MSFVPSMKLGTLVNELMQLFGKVSAIRKGEHIHFESETVDFYINTSVSLVMQYVDENFTRHKVPFPGLTSKEYEDLSVYVHEILRLIAMALFKNEEEMKRILFKVRKVKDHDSEVFIRKGANQTRLHYIRSFIQLFEVTQVIPAGKVIQPINESLLAYFTDRKHEGGGAPLTAEEQQMKKQYRELCKHAYDKLMSLRVFANEFPEDMSQEDHMEAFELARILGDDIAQDEFARGMFILLPPE